MSTLAEIEEAVDALPLVEKEELSRFLSSLLQREREREQETVRPSSLAGFAGVIRLGADPLEWQRSGRDEWR